MKTSKAFRLRNVETLEDFAKAVYTAQETIIFLKGVQANEFKDMTIAEFATKYNILRSTLDAIIRKCKALGIIYKTGWHDIRWSNVFQTRLIEIMEFYNKLSGKANPYQEAIRKYELLTDARVNIVLKEDKTK